jgi:hypothetical protein
MEKFKAGPALFPGAAALALVLASSAVLLVSCGVERNPVLGEWDVTVRTGNSRVDAAVGIFTAMKQLTVVFTKTEMQFKIAGPAGGTRPVTYSLDGDGRWMVCFGEGESLCQLFSFLDEQRNRAVFTVLGMDLSLTRRTGSSGS